MAIRSPAARSPMWIHIIRGVQVFFSLIIIGLSGDLIHGYYFNQLGFAIFCVLMTWLVAAYHFATEFNASLAAIRHPFAVIGIDALMALFWLSAMGATAALRASFKYSVDVEGCYNNGQLIDSDTCVVERSLQKRDAVVSHTGLDMMSGIAGLSALEWLLFTACLVYNILTWYQGRSKTGQATYQPQQQFDGYAANNQQAYAPQPHPQESYAQKPYVQPYVQGVQQPFEHPYVQQPQQAQPYQQQHYASQQAYNAQAPYSTAPHV